MDLFDQAVEDKRINNAPLAARMRPKTLDDFVGQNEIVGKDCLLRRAIEADRLSSVIFYGPPGCGKTTLAQIIAQTTTSNFQQISAVTAGIADIREIVKNANDDLKLYGKRTVLFIDEIHRFNKTQQDALLPVVESGLIVLIGATTENPYFEVNSALISRSRIFRLNPLEVDDILLLLKRAIEVPHGLSALKPIVDEDAFLHWATISAGDARTAYNALELACLTTDPDQQGRRHIDLKIAEESIQSKSISYDKDGDWHYDVISAFIKSMRGSDPDAALHWLARMVEAGEKPEFIARRIVICAAEDVGLADPMALVIAMAAADAVHFIGWPEARIALADAAVYIACAPKSNAAYMGIKSAQSDLQNSAFSGVPIHLRDASYRGAKNFGHGQGYKYPHDYQEGFVVQQYLPNEFKDKQYYIPTDNGRELKIKERLAYFRAKKKK